ncbi:MAG: 23S rRNA (adenine(2503)-C(2))-methyltransferase RlmN [Thermodesulfovibrionales bacterium]|nr:23S rRNA (adenine(2503)-C(2))-methyltransferase RlmN [Thermodesulfovibrionales bacterium]
MQKINLKSLSEIEICKLIEDLKLPSFRAKQLLHWIYERKVFAIEEITEFSKELRNKLQKIAFIGNLSKLDEKTSLDGTRKYLFGLFDSQTIESVLIPDGDRLTLCISSQVGCPLGCKFCATGRLGFKRNLEIFEIVDQIISISREISPKKITNLVFMGMGEPLLNFENLLEALQRISLLMMISPRRITVSTAGIVPKIKELLKKIININLAISLNATEDETRSYLMPINNTYPLKSLLKACREIPLPSRNRITFEYIMLKDINDSVADAKRLVNLLYSIPAKVNLIPFNPFEGCELQGSDEKSILLFQEKLLQGGIPTFIRKSKGKEILAACGQLRADFSTYISN